MTKAEFLALAAAKYDELDELKKSANFLEYERDLSQAMRELTRQVAQAQLGGKSKDRRKKKSS